jgi:formylglycine-generating enzyme required for sulfatase activity
MVESQGLAAPLYAEMKDGEYVTFGLHGLRVAPDDEPVVHLSFYEADALAHFLGGRLPTEAEGEVASARASKREGAWSDAPSLVPNAAVRAEGESIEKIRQMYGDAWEWTRSAYAPYPGYAPTAGATGEYNGKFMANQFVLRGGSFLTPRGHIRSTYRNFWHPHTRFQATGVRVAKDLRR